MGITVFGYIVLKDSEVLPSLLGGSGQFQVHFKDWPYVETTPMYKLYYLVSLGYHFG
jgi:hypothetical protein